ncbi:MAG: hypothetical protein AB7H90_03430 [Alphaproteobacteria bacterium]
MRAIADAGAAAVVVGALAKILPPLAAAFAVAWYSILIWESDHGKRWRARWKRLFSRQVSAEDRVAFVVLGLGGVGVALALVALGRFIQ